MKTALFRCDASHQIGLGHLTRLMELANRMREHNIEAVFAVNFNELVVAKLRLNNFRYFSKPEDPFRYISWMQGIIASHKIDIFVGDVRDGFPVELIRFMKHRKILTVAIDEASEYAKECDICFYPPHANIQISNYNGHVYQGFEYVILREPFYRDSRRPMNNNVLIMLGGTDPYHLSLPLINKMALSSFNYHLIIRNDHRDYRELLLNSSITIHSDVVDMANFLSEIDFAIIAFGTSVYEMVAMKIPFLTICLNQDHWDSCKYFVDQKLTKRYRKDNLALSTQDFSDLEVRSFQPEQRVLNIILDAII